VTKTPARVATLVVVAALVGAACRNPRGRPAPDSEVIPPREITDFTRLYASNCAGCHGAEGKDGAAIPLGDPVFLTIADDAVIRRIATTGVPGTPMPAFAHSAGGMLTDKQIDALVTGIRSWAKPDHLTGISVPPYAAQAAGDPSRGVHVYTTFCSSCHGPDGRGGVKASSIVEGAFLALVSDQELRTIVIVGRPDLGAPDWRNNVPGHPMSAQEISDVVAWLAAQRPEFPGPAPGPADTNGAEIATTGQLK
jgi:cytochrome c oxidase cbb3-type subunit III